jgi:hypothetical protein
MKILGWVLTGLYIVISLMLALDGAYVGGCIAFGLAFLSSPSFHTKIVHQETAKGKTYIGYGPHLGLMSSIWIVAFIYFVPTQQKSEQPPQAVTVTQSRSVSQDTRNKPLTKEQIDSFFMRTENLWDELQGFRYNQKFHEYGLSAGGRFSSWHVKQKALYSEYGNAIKSAPIEQVIRLGIGEAIGYQFSVALEWIRNQGKDNEESRDMSKRINEILEVKGIVPN